MNGRLDGHKILIGSIYVPNQGQLEFFHNLLVKIREAVTDKVLIGGDFNTVLDVQLDRSIPPLRGAPIHKLAKGMSEWMDGWDFVDV